MIDYDTWAEFYLEVEQMCIAGINKAWLRETPIQPVGSSTTSNLPLAYKTKLKLLRNRVWFGQK